MLMFEVAAVIVLDLLALRLWWPKPVHTPEEEISFGWDKM